MDHEWDDPRAQDAYATDHRYTSFPYGSVAGVNPGMYADQAAYYEAQREAYISQQHLQIDMTLGATHRVVRRVPDEPEESFAKRTKCLVQQIRTAQGWPELPADIWQELEAHARRIEESTGPFRDLVLDGYYILCKANPYRENPWVHPIRREAIRVFRLVEKARAEATGDARRELQEAFDLLYGIYCNYRIEMSYDAIKAAILKAQEILRRAAPAGG